MDYEISISDDKSFVIVRVKRPIPPAAALTFTKESVDFADKYNIRSFLIDVRDVEDKWGVIGDYEFAQALKNHGRRRQDRVALVTETSDKTHAFLETVTRNLGYNTRIFANYDDAVAWLKK
jgi:hypothetical protein